MNIIITFEKKLFASTTTEDVFWKIKMPSKQSDTLSVMHTIGPDSSMGHIICCRPSLSPSNQATSRLFKKAIAEAHKSVNQLANSSSYDPTLPPQPIKTNSYAEKQHQKELLLQQHRELVRQQQGMQEEQKEEQEEKEEQDATQKTEDDAAKEAETTSTTTAEVEVRFAGNATYAPEGTRLLYMYMYLYYAILRHGDVS